MPNSLTFNVVAAQVSNLFRVLHDIPAFELLCHLILFVLAVITVFRRKLSSNDEYRLKESNEIHQSKSSNPPLHVEITSLKPSLLMMSPLFGRKEVEVTAMESSGITGAFTFEFSEFSTEVIIQIACYLDDNDIGRLMAVSKQVYWELSADKIWEQLWIQTYGNMWQHAEVKKIREGRGILWDPMNPTSSEVGNTEVVPARGWRRFYFLFQVTWMDWLLAGYCTPSRCLLGLNRKLLDASSFIASHPGSPETLTEAGGCDATEAFEEIGHSTRAAEMLQTRQLVFWDPHARPDPSSTIITNNNNTSNTSARTRWSGCRESRRYTTRLDAEMSATKKRVLRLASSRRHLEASQRSVSEIDLVNSISTGLGANNAVNGRKRGISGDEWNESYEGQQQGFQQQMHLLPEDSFHGLSSQLHAALDIMQLLDDQEEQSNQAPVSPAMPDFDRMHSGSVGSSVHDGKGNDATTAHLGESICSPCDSSRESQPFLSTLSLNYGPQNVVANPKPQQQSTLQAFLRRGGRRGSSLPSQRILGPIVSPEKGKGATIWNALTQRYSQLSQQVSLSRSASSSCAPFLQQSVESSTTTTLPARTNALTSIGTAAAAVAAGRAASFFGPLHKQVPLLQDYCPCPSVVNDDDGTRMSSDGSSASVTTPSLVGLTQHYGHCKVYLNPLSQEWTVWWSCCGQGQTLLERDD